MTSLGKVSKAGKLINTMLLRPERKKNIDNIGKLDKNKETLLRSMKAKMLVR